MDHCFQKAGFDKKRLFYTQGDYGLWQCSEPCHQKTYDNEAVIRQMWTEQRGMRVPTELIPRCPRCGKPMAMNLRADDTFEQDEGWYAAAPRYGINEEYATGTSSCALACYLFQHYKQQSQYVFEQGFNLGSVSRLVVNITHQGGSIDTVHVGGYGHLVCKKMLLI